MPLPFLIGLFARFKWLKPLLVVAAVVGTVGLIAWGGATVKGWHASHLELAVVKPKLKAFEDAQAKANEKVKEQEPVDASEREALAAERERQERERQAISREWARINAVEESTDEAGNCTFRLSDDWGMCFAAAAAGDPADVAACEAAGGDGAVEAGTGGGGL